jgi:hypothetical protein
VFARRILDGAEDQKLGAGEAVLDVDAALADVGDQAGCVRAALRRRRGGHEQQEQGEPPHG